MNPHVTSKGSIGRVSIADYYFAVLIQPYPRMLSGNFIIGYHYLGIGRIASDHETLGPDRESPARE